MFESQNKTNSQHIQFLWTYPFRSGWTTAATRGKPKPKLNEGKTTLSDFIYSIRSQNNTKLDSLAVQGIIFAHHFQGIYWITNFQDYYRKLAGQQINNRLFPQDGRWVKWSSVEGPKVDELLGQLKLTSQAVTLNLSNWQGNLNYSFISTTYFPSGQVY